MKKPVFQAQDAQILAIKALEFIAMEEERISRFLQLTGMAPQNLSAEMQNPAFLGGVIDYLLNDETLLFEFCEFADIPANHPQAARLKLP